MMQLATSVQLMPDLWVIPDASNVYLVKDGDHALAIDFGSGEWMAALPSLGIHAVDHVLLTHHHPDGCAGLPAHEWPFAIHAPTGEQVFLAPDAVAAFHAIPHRGQGCPASYAVLPRGIAQVQYDMAGFTDFFWRGRRIRFLSTPGHGPDACTVLLDHQGMQIAFCGDAAHAGGTIWQPFHLEWDHWTGSGALAAWEGVQRLLGVQMDLLCPAHGPIIDAHPRQVLRQLARRLMRLYQVKGQISPSEPDRYLEPTITTSGAKRYSPHLYQFGENGYLLLSDSGEAAVVDPFTEDIPALEALLAELPGIHPAVSLVSHYHFDHCDAIPYLREKYGTRAWLHPRVAEPLQNQPHAMLPWRPLEPITADALWPEEGEWRWQEYTFAVAHWPGQTWWHCAFMTTVDGQRVFFAGDSFQPASRWNGTGGFCAYNNSRFHEGYLPSIQRVLDWRPDILAAGHNCCYRFSPAKFRKIQQWATAAEQAVRDLCPSGDLDRDYYIASKIIEEALPR